MNNKERNKLIAQRLGYHIYHYDKDVEAHCYYELWDAHGEPVNILEGERKTEAEAWDDAPDWSNNLTLALKLWEKIFNFQITCMANSWLIHWDDPMSDVVVPYTDDLATEISDFWLAKVDVKKLERDRQKEKIRNQIATLQEELHELERE